MKNIRILPALLLLAAVVPTFGQNKYPDEWKKVEQLVSKGLPQSALAIVDSVILDAARTGNTTQLLKASLYQVKLRADFQEDALKNGIAAMQVRLEEAGPPANQIYHSILAELYWRYYQANRYAFMERTAIAFPDDSDPDTWDLKTLVKTITRHYLASLEPGSMLQQASLDDYDPVIISAEGSRHYRPTLYDFLAHRALEYFMNDEPDIIQPAARFELENSSYFDPASIFSEEVFSSEDTVSLKFNALNILQALIAMHLGDDDPSALIDADLIRLGFVRDNSTLPQKDELYLEALLIIEKKYSANPASTDISYKIAQEYMRRGELYDPFGAKEYQWYKKLARQTCEDAVSRFPESDGAHNCSVLLNTIDNKEMRLTLRDANLPDSPFLGLLTYKNVKTVWFRVIKMDPETDRNLRKKFHGEELVDQYRQMTAVTAWKESLPDEGDYQTHSTETRLPALMPGYYIILASDTDNFITEDDHAALYTSCWITRISYMSKRNDDGAYELFVVDRETGRPLKGVTAQTFTQEYDYSSRTYLFKKQGDYLSDKEGYFTIRQDGKQSRSYYILFTHGNDRYATDNYFYQYSSNVDEKPAVRTHFFTDRSIYRPGQTIYFKGIVTESYAGRQEIKSGHTTVVTFHDVNGQKISEQLLSSNEFGSFNGVFTAPSGVLTGRMTIRNESGSVSISVEEYKRPRFEVVIDPVEGTYKLNEELTVRGAAKAFSGPSIDNAKVTYRVVRMARFPFWRNWWPIFPSSPALEITSGTTTTDDEGRFSLTFRAIPDLKVEKKLSPVFDYTIFVSVSDINGETRSDETVISVGYRSMIAATDIGNELDLEGKNNFSIIVQNLNGQPVSASGTITIHSLQQPGRILRERSWTRPDRFILEKENFIKEFPNEIYDDENNPQTWAVTGKTFEISFITPADSSFSIPGLSSWLPGVYKMVIQTQDSFGEKVEVTDYFTAYSPASDMIPIPTSRWFRLMKKEAEPGETVMLLAGSAEKNVRMLFEVQYGDTVVKREWIDVSNQQVRIEIPVLEAFRGNFSLSMNFIRGNRNYRYNEQIRVPYTNRELDIRFETFRDKLTPGQEEEWRLHVSGKKGEPVMAEMLASMYDASLDEFLPHAWAFDIFRYRTSGPSWDAGGAFSTRGSYYVIRRSPSLAPLTRSYDRLNWFGFNFYGRPALRGVMFDAALTLEAAPGMGAKAATGEEAEKAPEASKQEEYQPTGKPVAPAKAPDVPVRRNFEETAFFYPELRTDENGGLVIGFRVPESITAWKFQGLAITTDLKYGMVTKELVTRKDLMVVPNPPRFFREGDHMTFRTKVVSLSDEKQQGDVKLSFYNAYTMESINDLMGLADSTRIFTVEKGKSAVFGWDITIPDGLEAIVYRVSAASGEFSDGEEAVVPVLPNRMLVTESLPLPIIGPATKKFNFDKLLASGGSATLKPYRLTLEYSSNPAWYAVQALPYLAGNTKENSDALMERFYANSLATFIANSNPRIKQVFESWRNLAPDALMSNLEKNEQLKSILLEETPWVRQARNESERKQRIALLFDLNRMATERKDALIRLQRMQSPNGGWPWFEGMPENRYITQLIVEDMGRLHQLGVMDVNKEIDVKSMMDRAITYIDQRICEDYEDLKKHSGDIKMEDDHLGSTQVQYLYARSFFIGKVGLNAECREAYDYYTGQSIKYWNGKDKYLQGMIALALFRAGDLATSGQIIGSLKEHALHSEEMGMYWKAPEGWYWYQAPVERQALMIEAFTEITGDTPLVEEMKTWLLKHKQTNDWKTGRATADAIYALLLRGGDWLVSDALVKVSLGNEKIDPAGSDGTAVEAGTGYYQLSWNGREITPDMGRITVTKEDKGVAWGAVYWQYFENLEKISSARTPLSLEKELFVEINTPAGPILEKIGEGYSLKTGDKVKIRIVLRVDRDMEYLHLKDMRASAFEPVNVLSGYKHQGGLGYYEATKDASVNFFFDRLQKGTHVFEYALVATQSGDFSNGITSIQCLYAPEFSSHSEGVRIRIE